MATHVQNKSVSTPEASPAVLALKLSMRYVFLVVMLQTTRLNINLYDVGEIINAFCWVVEVFYYFLILHFCFNVLSRIACRLPRLSATNTNDVYLVINYVRINSVTLHLIIIIRRRRRRR